MGPGHRRRLPGPVVLDQVPDQATGRGTGLRHPAEPGAVGADHPAAGPGDLRMLIRRRPRTVVVGPEPQAESTHHLVTLVGRGARIERRPVPEPVLVPHRRVPSGLLGPGVLGPGRRREQRDNEEEKGLEHPCTARWESTRGPDYATIDPGRRSRPGVDATPRRG